MLTINAPDPVLIGAAAFYAEFLGILDYDTEIEIGHTVEDGYDAFVLDEGHRFVIAIHKSITCPVSLFEALAHEMVHVKQFVTGEMEDLPGGMIRWKRRNYKDAKINSKRYFSVPWEAEAFKMQGPLCEALFRDQTWIKILLDNRDRLN